LQSIEVLVKVRHSKELFKCKLAIENKQYKIILETKIFAVTSGQSAVFYENNDLVGGGFIV
jgi:tRNA-specific 2-thiouridylase